MLFVAHLTVPVLVRLEYPHQTMNRLTDLANPSRAPLLHEQSRIRIASLQISRWWYAKHEGTSFPYQTLLFKPKHHQPPSVMSVASRPRVLPIYLFPMASQLLAFLPLASESESSLVSNTYSSLKASGPMAHPANPERAHPPHQTPGS